LGSFVCYIIEIVLLKNDINLKLFVKTQRKLIIFMSGLTLFYLDHSINPPVGSINQYFGTTDPDGWVICDGVTRTSSDGRYSDLAALLNTMLSVSSNNSNSITPPNLRDKFLFGSDTTSSDIGTFSGSTNVTLTTSTLPGHTHTGNTTAQSADHAHTIVYARDDANSPLNDGANIVRISVPGPQRTTGGASTRHKHDFTSAASGQDAANIQPFSILPPCFLINHIMKY